MDLTILRRRFSLTLGPALFYIVCETRQMLSEQANPYSANPDLDESGSPDPDKIGFDLILIL